MSTAADCSLDSTLVHVLPPSADLKIPRPELGLRSPTAATRTRSALLGSIRMVEMERVSARPIFTHDAPESVDLKMPLPGVCSPVPTYTMFGREGATATAPTDATGT